MPVLNGVDYKIQGLASMLRKLGPKLVADQMRVFLTKSAIVVQNRARQKTPVDRGRLRNSITTEVDGAQVPLWAKIGTNVPSAKPVEFGTGLLSEAPDSKKRRYFPPPAALDLWARRHGLPSGFVVAMAIFKRGGTKPVRMLINALRDSQSDISGYLKDAGRAIGRKWSRLGGP